MRTTFSTLMIFLLLQIQAQTFESLIEKGDELYDQEQYLESAQAYDQAFVLGEGTAWDYYNAACSWALTGDTIRSMKYLHLSADKGWRNLKHMKRDSDLTVARATQGWERVLVEVQANVDEFEKDFDKPLQKRLNEIYVRDQTLRMLYKEAQDKFGRDSEEMTYFWSVVAAEDSLNTLEVIEILDTRGWVGQSLVGGRANMALWLVIQHAPLEIQEKYLPLLKASVLEGESSGNHLALLEDRIEMRNGRPQIYGSQFSWDQEAGKQVLHEIREPEYVNQRRKAVGLGPIEDYVKRWGIEWTVEQKEK